MNTYTVYFLTKNGAGGYVVVNAPTKPYALHAAKRSIVPPSHGDRVVKVSLSPL